MLYLAKTIYMQIWKNKDCLILQKFPAIMKIFVYLQNHKMEPNSNTK